MTARNNAPTTWGRPFARGNPYPSPEGDTAAKRHSVRAAYAGKVLDWLASNATSRLATTKDAIEQAIAALWPSQCGKSSAVLKAP
jgi:hypothetical protein